MRSILASGAPVTVKAHGHNIAETEGLQAALDAKSPTGHQHDIADVSGLVSTLAGKSDTDHGHPYLPLVGGTLTGAIQLPADPQQPLEAVTKQYVDGVASGLDVKKSCRAATLANAGLFGLSMIDGVALAEGDRVLVKAQADSTENGIYVAAAGAWVRAADADEDAEISAGLFTFVEEGATLADTGWVLTSGPATIGVDPIEFSKFSSAGDVTLTQGDGITITQDGFNFTVTAHVTQAAFDAALAGKSNTGHGHGIIDITGLQAALDDKLGATGTAVAAQKWATARTLTLIGDVSGSALIDGSGDVSLNVTVGNYTHGHIIADVTGLQAALDSKAAAGHAHTYSLNDLSDVATVGATTGQVLKKQANGSYAFQDEETAPVTSVDGRSGIVNLSDRYEPLGKLHDDRYYTQTALDVMFSGKAALSHAHDIADVTGLSLALSDKLGATATAVAAQKWATGRFFTVSGGASGSVLIDGTSNVTLNLTITDDSHNHIIANVDGLQVALDGKANNAHTHTIANLTDFYAISRNADTYAASQFWGTRHALTETTANPGSYYHIANLGGDGTARGTQIASHYGASETFKIRRRSDNNGAPNGAGQWQPWRQIWTSADFDPSNFLPVAGTAAAATKLATSRTITLGGHLAGSTVFDGSQNVTITATVADNSHGHTWGNISAKPTTIAGYGISDGYTKAEVDALIAALISGQDHKEAVNTYADLATTYPAPEQGWTVSVLDVNKVYLYDGASWIIIAEGTVPLANNLVDGKLSAADYTKLQGIEVGAQKNRTPAQMLADMLAVDGSGSGLDADLLDGYQASYFAAASHVHALGDLSNVHAPTPLDGQAVVWVAANNRFELATVADGGVTDHGLLNGLADDDHLQYHTNARGDARYYQKSEVDTALSGKAASVHYHSVASLSDVTITTPAAGHLLQYDGANYVNKSLAAAGVAAANHAHAWAEITGKPSSFTPSAHAHGIGDVTGLQTALDAKSSTSHNHSLDGLSNVTITTAVDGQILARFGTGWVNRSLADAGIAAAAHGHTKADIGLGNVDDTSDANKPVSLAQQAALDNKSNLGHGHAWNDISGKPATFTPSAHAHAISDVTGLQSALDGKSASNHNHDGTYAAAAHNHDGTYAKVNRIFVAQNTTALKEQDVAVNTAAGALTITAPATPAENDQFWVGDGADNASVNNITVDFGASTFRGANQDFTIDIDGFQAGFRYLGGTWRIFR